MEVFLVNFIYRIEYWVRHGHKSCGQCVLLHDYLLHKILLLSGSDTPSGNGGISTNNTNSGNNNPSVQWMLPGRENEGGATLRPPRRRNNNAIM